MADSTGTDQAPPEVSKESIRKKMWEHIEAENLANFPRPVTKRIPNFKGAEEAAVKAAELDAFQKAQTVKINPDKPQQHSRYLTIEAKKTLLVPTPRLRTGLFNKIIPPEEQTKDVLRICSTSQGVREHSVPLGLDANTKIDLVIVGSVAVSRTGLRIGKGEGFADLEYAMMMTMGAITPQTPVVTTVHDCQIEDVPESLMGPHDLNVDFIVTPTQTTEGEGEAKMPVTSTPVKDPKDHETVSVEMKMTRSWKPRHRRSSLIGQTKSLSSLIGKTKSLANPTFIA